MGTSTADNVAYSVGPSILEFIAPVIAKRIDKRSLSVPSLHARTPLEQRTL